MIALSPKQKMNQERAAKRAAWRVYPTFNRAYEFTTEAWERMKSQSRSYPHFRWALDSAEFHADDCLTEIEDELGAAPAHLRDAWVDELTDLIHELEEA
jgi:hypothetical protein